MNEQDLALVNKHAGCFGNIIFTMVGLEAFLAERDAQQADKVRELEAKILDLPRYSFLSPKEGGVRRCGDKSGAWIERYEVIKLLEAMKEANQ